MVHHLISCVVIILWVSNLFSHLNIPWSRERLLKFRGFTPRNVSLPVFLIRLLCKENIQRCPLRLLLALPCSWMERPNVSFVFCLGQLLGSKWRTKPSIWGTWAGRLSLPFFLQGYVWKKDSVKMILLILTVYFFSKAFISNLFPLQVNCVCGKQHLEKEAKEGGLSEERFSDGERPSEKEGGEWMVPCQGAGLPLHPSGCQPGPDEACQPPRPQSA